MLLRLVVSTLSAGITVLGAGPASGQEYPNKPVRIITGSAGGGPDFTARLVAQGLTGALGQPVIVDNRGGGIASSQAVSQAPPDGYTLLVNGGTFYSAPLLQKMPYDPVRDFAAVTLVIKEPNVLVAHPSLPVKSVKDLIALAKARPGQLNSSFSSVGGSGHLAAELFKVMANVNIVSISYKNSSQAFNDLVSGEVQLAFQGTATVTPYIKSGKVRALGVATADPSALFPGLPTVAASGLPGFESAPLTGLYAPAKTPDAAIRRLNQESVRFLRTTEAKERFLKAGVEVIGSTPEESAAKIKSEMAKMAKLITDTGIKAQ